MSAFDLLAKVSQFTKPYLGFKRLRIGNHEIVNFKLVNNKMYKPDAENPKPKRVLMVELKDQVLFMPDYITRVMGESDEKVAELNSDGRKKYMFFGGNRESNK